MKPNCPEMTKNRQMNPEEVPMTTSPSNNNADMDGVPPCHQTQGSQEEEDEDNEEEEVPTVILDKDEEMKEYQLKVVFPHPPKTTTVCQFRDFATALFEIDETATIKAQDLNLQRTIDPIFTEAEIPTDKISLKKYFAPIKVKRNKKRHHHDCMSCKHLHAGATEGEVERHGTSEEDLRLKPPTGIKRHEDHWIPGKETYDGNT